MNHDDYIAAREDVATETDREPSEEEVLSRMVQDMERKIDQHLYARACSTRKEAS